MGERESVIRGWNDSNSDGGTMGLLGDSFDIRVVHRGEWSVRDRTVKRIGVDEWVFVDGTDLGSPVVLSSFDDEPGDVSVRRSRAA